MRTDTKTQLESNGFALLAPNEPKPYCCRAVEAARRDDAEVIAECRKNCDKTRTGFFAIPFDAAPSDTAVRRAIRHAKSCRAAQELKDQRRRMGEWPKPRTKGASRPPKGYEDKHLAHVLANFVHKHKRSRHRKR